MHHKSIKILRMSVRISSEAANLSSQHIASAQTPSFTISRRDSGVSLHELIDTHRAAFNMAARVAVEGEYVVVSPHFAVQIGMALHELATNSVKYGAFGGDGRVEINWTMTARNENRLSLILNWVEIHDRARAPGKHQGFGHLLLTQIVPANLNGTRHWSAVQASFAGCYGRTWMVDIAAPARGRLAFAGQSAVCSWPEAADPGSPLSGR